MCSPSLSINKPLFFSKGRADSFRVVLLTVSSDIYAIISLLLIIRTLKHYRVPLHTQFGSDGAYCCCMDTMRPGALVQASSESEIDNWMALPSRHRVWVCFRITTHWREFRCLE